MCVIDINPMCITGDVQLCVRVSVAIVSNLNISKSKKDERVRFFASNR